MEQRHYRQSSRTPPSHRITERISEEDVFALRALEEGSATPGQQMLALRCIMVKLSGLYDQEFVVGHADQSAFRGGRAFVGRFMMKLLRADVDQLLGVEQHENS